MSGNLCRCGAYVGILAAVREAAASAGAPLESPMNEFEYRRAEDAAGAVAMVAGGSPRPGSSVVAPTSSTTSSWGWRDPRVLVDVSRLPMDQVEETDRGLRIGANVRNSDLAAHPAVRAGWPVVARALLSGASGQLRHQATTGGNLLQRTRCVYFQDVTTPCNKREPGTGCSAIGGYSRYNAVLGASDACVAVHPSDLAVALAAVDALVVVLGPDGERRLPLTDLHRLPDGRPDLDTTLAHGDLITAVELPASPAASRSTYHKARDRASYAFALVSVAAALELEGDEVRDVRIAWGGVAHRPWRATRAEEALRGQPIDGRRRRLPRST